MSSTVHVTALWVRTVLLARRAHQPQCHQQLQLQFARSFSLFEFSFETSPTGRGVSVSNLSSNGAEPGLKK